MFSSRILLMRPALHAPISPQIRAFGLARIALEPARKTAPPPPPPPPPTRARKPAATITVSVATPAKKSTATATTKAAPVVAAPAPRTRLTDKERAARDKVKEREQLAKAKEREKLAKAKERQKEREKSLKLKEREKVREKKEKEKLREAARKEKTKAKAEAAKIKDKPYPPPPKAPRTPYLMFSTDPNIKRDRGEGVRDDAPLASQAWKALSEAEREAYSKKHEQARAVWKREVEKWIASLNLAQLQAARSNREPGTRDESAMTTLPRRPGNAYALFLGEMTNRPDFRNKVDALLKKEGIANEQEANRKKVSYYGRTAAELWKSMSDKEKAIYSSKAEQAKEQWDKDFGHLMAAQKEEIVASLP